MLQRRLGRSPPLPTPASNHPSSPHETDKLCRVNLHQHFHQLHFSPEAPCWVVVEGESAKIRQPGGILEGRFTSITRPPELLPRHGAAWRVQQQQQDAMPQHPFHGLAQAAGSRELLPRTASGFGFDLEGEILRHRPDWHAALRRDRPRSRCTGRPPSPRSFQHPPEQPPPHIHSPPNLPVAKVLYLLDVAIVTKAEASCRHPSGRCFPLPGRAGAGGARRAPRPVFLASEEAGSRSLPWAPRQRSVPPSDLQPPREHTPRERSGLGAPTRTSVGLQRPPARGTGDGAGAAQATLPAREPRDCGGSRVLRLHMARTRVGDSLLVPCAPSRCGRRDAAEGTLRTRGRNVSAAVPARARRGREK